MSIKQPEVRPSSKIPMEIVSLDIQMVYNLDHTHVTEYICRLCRRNLAAPTLEDIQAGNINSKCSLGKCMHTFHSTCIDKYIKAGNMSCPIDMTSWTLSRELDQNVVFKKIVHKSKSDANTTYAIRRKAPVAVPVNLPLSTVTVGVPPVVPTPQIGPAPALAPMPLVPLTVTPALASMQLPPLTVAPAVAGEAPAISNMSADLMYSTFISSH